MRPADIYQPSAAANRDTLAYVSSTCSSLAGVLAGTLGLTGLPGFALFLLNALLVRLLFAVTKIGKADYSRYFVGGKWELATGGLPSEGFGFILFWTLFYSLVHIYD